MSFIKKIRKLIRTPNLYFYDLFAKRLGKQTYKQTKTLKKDNDNNEINQILFDLIKADLIKQNEKNKNEMPFQYVKDKKILFRYYNYLENYRMFFDNYKIINCINEEYYNDSFKGTECLLVHGQANNIGVSKDIVKALSRKQPIVFGEDGFVHSIVRPVDSKYEQKYRTGCSLILDFCCAHFDKFHISEMDRILNSNMELNASQKKRARECINLLLDNYITKYNNQPIIKPSFANHNNKKVLLIDQAVADLSIEMCDASISTFHEMLYDAINENPDAEIFIKVHPDMINNPKRGTGIEHKFGNFTDFDFSNLPNVHLIAEYINPIALLKYVDKVYVVSSQMGFEALLCGKDVKIYGAPFYAGWGCGECRAPISKRFRKRTIEDIFYVAYIMCSNYINPITREKCELEDLIKVLCSLREEYFIENNMEDLLPYKIKRNNDRTGIHIIDIAFTFDKNFLYQTIVAIMSLLDSNVNDDVKYNVHCIYESDVSESDLDKIRCFSHNHRSLSSLNFYSSEQNYLNAYECRNITRATYLRLSLHNILKDLDKVIFSDVDVLFNNSLYEVFNIEMGKFLCGACIDVGMNTQELYNKQIKNFEYWRKEFYYIRGRYYSAGFMLMNLSEIRKTNLDKVWNQLSTRQFYYQDMDIINMTINDKIMPLSSKYCVIPRYVKNDGYLKAYNEGFLCYRYYLDTKVNPVIYHYASKKPWDDKSVVGAEIWWEYIKRYPAIYTYFSERYAKLRLNDK